jgi:hypothetical protein
MAFKMKKNPELIEVVKELRGAVKAHGRQADTIEKHMKDMEKDSPMKGKISPSCKAQAKKKFKVWPSAYASGWGVRCTRGDFKKNK